MGKPSKELMAFMEHYKVDSDEIWEVHGSTWVIKHKALERVAAEQGIAWDAPQVVVCDPANKIAVICAHGRLGERKEWSFGEAAPANNKNAYCVAMAEKRSKDRVILKLLNAHGALYSEAEADEFVQPRQNPHVNRPEDFVAPTEYDRNGVVIDNIPQAAGTPKPKAKSRADFDGLQKEIWATGTPVQLESWGKSAAERVAALPLDWQELVRGTYREHMDALRGQDQQDERRMAS